jgi:hypothetical protein
MSKMIKNLITVFVLVIPQICTTQDLTFTFVDDPVTPNSGITGEVDNLARRLRVSGIANPQTSRYVSFYSDVIPLSGIKTMIFEADISLPTGLRTGILDSPDPCGDRSDSSMGTPVLFRISFTSITFAEISMQAAFGLRLEQVNNFLQLQDEISKNGGMARVGTYISDWTGGPAIFDPSGLTSGNSVGAQFHVRLSIDFELNKVMAEIIPHAGFEKRFNPLPVGSEESIASPFIAVTNLIDYTKDQEFSGNIFYSIHVRTNGNTDIDDASAPGGTLRYIEREFTNIQVHFNQPINFPTIPQLLYVFFPDDFNDNILKSYWTRYVIGGLSFITENGVLKLSGTSGETGFSSFITSAAKRQNCTVEMDFRAPSEIQSLCMLRIGFDGYNYFEIGIGKDGYRLTRVMENQVEATGDLFPLIGDETTNFHHIKLSYNDATGHIEAFIDSILLDGINDKLFPLSFTSINFEFYTHAIKDQYIQYEWDNFNSFCEDQRIFIVTNTKNSGPGSLRQAIFDANASIGPDSIVFAIPLTDSGYNPATGVFTIQPDYVMPALEDSSTNIDGISQSIYVGNDSNPSGPEIAMDGININDNSWGFFISSHDNKISNLLINNFIKGISIDGSNASRNIIKENFIGTDYNGVFPLGNKWGIYIIGGANNNQIGPNNIISYNDSDGVKIIGTQSTGNIITRNSITNNGGLGISNDSGGNTELNSPIITNLGNDTISGTTASGSIVEVFFDPENEGEDYQGFTISDSSGKFSFVFTDTLKDQYITATSTDTFGNTSEFSAPISYADTAINYNSESEGKIPKKYDPPYNYPNPFNKVTTIEYQLPENSEAIVEIYNTFGRIVKTLVKEKQTAGYYSVLWDTRDETGNIVSNGIYLCILRTKNYIMICKMIILR